MIPDFTKNYFIATLVLCLVLTGNMTSKGLNKYGQVNSTDLKYLAGAMTCENGNNSDLCQLLTGSVILNRLKSNKWNGNTIEEVIMATDGGYTQYARTTRNNFKTIKSSKRTKLLAKYLLIFGSIAPDNVVYQTKNKNAGSGVYWKEPTPNESIKYEYFCYE